MSSERVRLEVAILSADEAPLENAPPPHDGAGSVTILTVAADADIRRYVRECLRERQDVRVFAAATIADALMLAARDAPRVLVVDAPQSEILMALVHVRAVILVDELPDRAPQADSRVRFLPHPFTPAGLIAQVNDLLHTGAA